MFGLHTPDGLLNAPVAAVLAVVSFVAVGFALHRAGRSASDRMVPLAGLTAAFLFAAQMVNFPVGAGTSAHLVGGALAAILLGPDLATVTLAVVVVAQALLFSDGGITALGINLLNLAIVPTYGGWATYRLARRVLPARAGGVLGACGLAAAVSVELSAIAFSIEWLFGATAPVGFDIVTAAMIGVHLPIAVTEAVITALVVAAVMASRPDLLAQHGDLPTDLDDRRLGWQPFVVGTALVIAVVAAVLAPFASAAPDGLERATADAGIAGRSTADTPGGLFSEYAVEGVDHPRLATAIAGLGGAAVCGLVGFGIMRARRV